MEKVRNVLNIIPSYEPAWAFGGTVTAVSQLCRALVQNGVDVTVYTTDADGKGGHLDVPLGKPVLLGGVKVCYFHCNFGKKRAFYSKDLSMAIKKSIFKFDLVHAASIWQWHQQTLFSFSKKYGVPCIITPHSSLMKFAFYSIGNHFIKNIFWRFFVERTVLASNAIQYLSEGERSESIHSVRSLSSFVVPNGIDHNKFRYSEKKRISLRKKLSISEKALVLLFLGRIHPKKNIELIIKALPHLIPRVKDIVLLIAGHTEDEEYYNDLRKIESELNLKNYIVWNGPVSNNQVLDYYNASDIMVLPSVVEGISMAILEAMSSSLPVVISKGVANWMEIQSDSAGLIVDSSLSSVQEELLKICVNPGLLRDLSQNARRSVETRYDINKVARLMIKAYEDVLLDSRSSELKWE